MDDPLNTIELELVNLIKGDTGGYPDNDLTELEDENIHQKLQDDIRRYYAHQLPAVGVMSLAYRETDDNNYEIDNIIQIVNYGGDFAVMDAGIKTIMGKIIKLLRDEKNDGVHTCLLDNAEEIYNISGDMIHGVMEIQDKKIITILGEIRCTVKVTGD